MDFSPGHWRFVNQRSHVQAHGELLIPAAAHPLELADRDRSELLVFKVSCGRELFVPCLEFFSRYYGRSGHVSRVLATYPWDEAEDRLYLPFEYAGAPGGWPIKLASSSYNADAVFLAHVKYDAYARLAAKGIYAQLEAQYEQLGGLAFPKISPWFKGPATLIVQGRWLDKNRFLALRIAGGSDPSGPDISAFRENPGKADRAAPEGSPLSAWRGSHERLLDTGPPIINLTADEEPDHNGNVAEVLNPVFRTCGPKREVIRRKLAQAVTQPRTPISSEQSDRHSAGERHGSNRGTGLASIRTEAVLESHGATRDVWEALSYLKVNKQILDLGWYSATASKFCFTEEPCMVALVAFDKEQQKLLTPQTCKWVYLDVGQSTTRGVLVMRVETSVGHAYLFEVQRRTVTRTAEDGRQRTSEEPYSGLVVLPTPLAQPSDWVPKILDGIRRERGVMGRVLSYCPKGRAHGYRRSKSSADKVAAHSTVINALSKVGIQIQRQE